MALIDELRREAAKKKNFNPNLPTQGAGLVGQNYGRPSPVVRPFRLPALPAPTPTPMGAPAGTQAPIRPSETGIDWNKYRNEAVAANSDLQVNDQGELEAPGPSWASRAFSGLIDVVDTPRAFITSSVKEGLDAVGITDGDASFDDLISQTRANYRFGELMQDLDAFTEERGWNPYVSTGIGFVGDLAADPLTYAGLGTVTGVAKGTVGGSLDDALRVGSRRGLAETVAREASERGIQGDAVDKLIREAGQRGRGAFTRQGLQRSGADADLLKQLGLTAQFGYSAGRISGKGRRLNLGGRALAETSENVKGVLKLNIGSSKAAHAGRRLFVGDRSAMGRAERAMVNNVITGASNAAESARGLVAVRTAKNDAMTWAQNTTHDAARNFKKKFKGMDAQRAAAISDMIETGDFSDALSREISGWFEQVGKELREAGVDFGNVSGGTYVPHMYTEKARRAMLRGKNVELAGFDPEEAFMKARTVKQGDEFMGETVPVVTEAGDFATIAQMNEIANRKIGTDLFETDIRLLMEGYVAQAAEARMSRKFADSLVDLEVGQSADSKVAKEVAAQEEAMAKATEARKTGLDDAKVRVQRQIDAGNSKINELNRQVAEHGQNVSRLSNKIQANQAKLGGLEAALREQQAVLDAARAQGKRLRGAEKSKITKQITKLQNEISGLRKTISSQKRRLGRVQNADLAQDAAAQIGAAKQRIPVLEDDLANVKAARQELDDPALQLPEQQAAEMVGAAEKIVDLEDTLVRVRQEMNSIQKEYIDAANQNLWFQMDVAQQRNAIDNTLDELQQIKVKADTPEGAAHQYISEQATEVSRLLSTQGWDGIGETLRDQMAAAVKYDMDAWNHMVTAADYRQRIAKALDDGDFHKFMEDFLDDGFKMIDDKVGVPEWMEAAMRKVPRSQGDWQATKDWILSAHDAFMNVWKGIATTSPGFMFRNWYSGAFGMYLDNVSINNVRKYTKFMHKYHTDGMDAAMAWARKPKAGGTVRYSDQELKALEDSITAASAAGWGLNPAEISEQAIGGKAGLNPFKVNFAPTRAVRHGSTYIEAQLRGAHAYDVLLRGGSVDDATRHVEKFHFNYRDITDFDRAAKRVIPFWTFYSRNMALQADVWARFPHKLNRSYFNLKENLELQSDPDAVVPGYFEEMGAIRLPGDKNAAGGSNYFTPDLPSLRFRQDAAALTGTGADGFDPIRLLSSASPLVKTPVEQLQDRKLFTDAPFNDNLHEYGSDGMTLREGNPILSGQLPTGFGNFDIPGLSQVMPHATVGATKIASMLPGMKDLDGSAQVIDGKLVMSDRGQQVFEDMMPLLGRVERLSPNTEKYGERQGQSALSFLGVPLRANTEQAIQGELYVRSLMSEQEMREEAYKEMLRSLVP